MNEFQDFLYRAVQPDKQDGNYDFVRLHNIAKYIIFHKEGSEATLLMATHMLDSHKELLSEPPQGDSATRVTSLTHQILSQKVTQFEVWKVQMSSLDQRAQNIINLVSGQVSPKCLNGLTT